MLRHFRWRGTYSYFDVVYSAREGVKLYLSVCEWIILVKSLDNVKYLHDNYITGQFVPNESYDNLTTLSG